MDANWNLDHTKTKGRKIRELAGRGRMTGFFVSFVALV